MEDSDDKENIYYWTRKNPIILYYDIPKYDPTNLEPFCYYLLLMYEPFRDEAEFMKSSSYEAECLKRGYEFDDSNPDSIFKKHDLNRRTMQLDI